MIAEVPCSRVQRVSKFSGARSLREAMEKASCATRGKAHLVEYMQPGGVGGWEYFPGEDPARGRQ